MTTIKFLRLGTDDKGRNTATFDVNGEEVTRTIAPNFQEFGTLDKHLTDLATGLIIEFSSVPEEEQTLTTTFQEGDTVVEN